jgi:hypothetical protein
MKQRVALDRYGPESTRNAATLATPLMELFISEVLMSKSSSDVRGMRREANILACTAQEISMPAIAFRCRNECVILVRRARS